MSDVVTSLFKHCILVIAYLLFKPVGIHLLGGYHFGAITLQLSHVHTVYAPRLNKHCYLEHLLRFS